MLYALVEKQVKKIKLKARRPQITSSIKTAFVLMHDR